MDSLFYRPQDAWVGDLIPYSEGGEYYCFYLHDPRHRADEYAEETTWYLAKTTDFVHMTDCGEAIKRGTVKEPDKNAYTGSVIRGKEAQVHAFFTGYNDSIQIDGKVVQCVMQAIGDDPEHLVTDKSFRFISDGVIYEEFDWRDPFVFYNEDEGKYWMLLCSRRKGAGGLRGGCVGLAKSYDLVHWAHAEPFYEPNMYVAPECPEVFKWGKWWYLLFSEFNERFATHYRIARSVNGPWIIPQDDVIDTRADYAIKTVASVSDPLVRYALGWVPTKRGETDYGAWEWGGNFIPHELHQDESDGHLLVRPVPAMLEWYGKSVDIGDVTSCNIRHCERSEGFRYAPLHTTGGATQPPVVECRRRRCIETTTAQEVEIAMTIESTTLGAALWPVEGDAFRMEMDIVMDEVHEAGLALHCDAGLNEGYFLRINPATRTAAWDMWPRRKPGKYQWQVAGDVPYQVETQRLLPDRKDVAATGGELHLTVIREDTICTVYINNEIALTTRMYNHKGGFAGVYAVQGCVTVKDLAVYRKW